MSRNGTMRGLIVTRKGYAKPAALCSCWRWPSSSPTRDRGSDFGVRPNNGMQRTALRAAADTGRYTARADTCARTDWLYYSYVHHRECGMTSTKRAPRRPAGRRGKVRKEFWLDPKALQRAQIVLGTVTERETVERALDIVAFRAEIQEGVAALAGLELDRRAERA